MAICPECHSQKPFLAPRCHACNYDIGLWGQFVTQLWFLAGQLIGIGLFLLIVMAFFG